MNPLLIEHSTASSWVRLFADTQRIWKRVSAFLHGPVLDASNCEAFFLPIPSLWLPMARAVTFNGDSSRASLRLIELWRRLLKTAAMLLCQLRSIEGSCPAYYPPSLMEVSLQVSTEQMP